MPAAAVSASVPRVLLGGAVDYAGMFPPAGLGLEAAVQNYLRYRASPDAWALGRLVVPGADLERLARALAGSDPRDPVRVAAVFAQPDAEIPGAVAPLHASGSGGARVEAIELRISSDSDIQRALALIPPAFLVYLEVPVGSGATSLLERIAASGGRAKFRTGGTLAEAFPSPDALLATLHDAVRLGVPFKATAGLHHALRGSYPLSYEAGASCASMFGFLNLLLALACLGRGALREAGEALTEPDPGSLRLDDGALVWRGFRFGAAELAELRRSRFHGFGSCSFREPLDELAGLAWT